MALWMDRPTWPAHDTLFSHLVSDGGWEATGRASWQQAVAELSDAVSTVDLHAGWVDGDHADVPASHLEALVEAGAQIRSAREITAMLRATGQRLAKRKQERCLRRTVVDEARRTDLVRSPQPVAGGEARGIVLDAGGRLAMVERGGDLHLPPAPAGGRPVGRLEFAQRPSDEPGGDPQRAEGPAVVTHRIGYLLVDGAAPTDAIRGVTWLTRDQAQARCGDAPWWPLVAHGLERGWPI